MLRVSENAISRVPETAAPPPVLNPKQVRSGVAAVVSGAREIQPTTDRAMSAISVSDSHFLVSHTEITRPANDNAPERGRLSDADVERIRERRAAGDTCRSIAKDYNRRASCISQICRGELHRSAPGPITLDDRSDPPEVKFWRRVDRSGGPNACWPWIGGRNEDGYGLLLRREYGEKTAHRYALRSKLGRPLRPGMGALHECDNPPCCNPDHLWEGTNLDNIHDRDAKGRHYSTVGAKNPKALLTDEQVIALRAEFATLTGSKRDWIRTTAIRLGVKWWSLENIVYGKTWRHLRGPAARELLARSCTHDDAPCPGCLTGHACDGPAVYSLWLPGDELGAEGLS